MTEGPLELPVRPRLKPWYRIAPTEDGVAVEYGDSVLRFGGAAATRLLPLLLPLLDGTRTLAEIAGVLGGPVRPAVDNAVARLADHGLLVDGPALEAPALTVRTAAFCAAGLGGRVTESDVAAVLRAARIAVVGSGPLAAELIRVLRLSGIGAVNATGWDVHDDQALLVAAPSPDELECLADLNVARLASGAPWLQVLPFGGRSAVVGPLYVPGETACYECLRVRRASNSGFAEEFWALERVTPRWGATPALDALVSGAAASLILRWVVAHDALLPGRFFTIGFDDALEVAAHVVYRVPRCAACSGLAAVADPLPWADVA